MHPRTLRCPEWGVSAADSTLRASRPAAGAHCTETFDWRGLRTAVSVVTPLTSQDPEVTRRVALPARCGARGCLAQEIPAGLRRPWGFPFRTGRTRDRQGSGVITAPPLIKTNGPLRSRGDFSGLSTSHFTPQGRPGGDCSGFVYLSAYLHFGCPHQPIPCLGLMQSQPLTF